MVRSGASKWICDDALEFEAYVRFHTSLDVHILHGGVSETVMLGGTSDISQFFGHRFYNWVMFRDEPIQYSDENLVFGRYLGPTIYTGLEITAKIMNANIEVVHLLTYCGIKEDESSNRVHISLRKDFENSIREIFGQDISRDDFQMSVWRIHLCMTCMRMIPRMRRVVW